MKQYRELARLYASFFKIGAMTFGGGYSMLPFLEREIAGNRAWCTKEEILDYFAISQSLPGIIGINVATFIGSSRAGTVGGLFAALGVVTPSIIVISLIASFISGFADIAWVARVMNGMNIAVAALLTDAVVKMTKKAVMDPVTAVLAIGAFVCVAFFRVSSVLLILVAVAVGVIVGRRRARTGGDGGET